MSRYIDAVDPFTLVIIVGAVALATIALVAHYNSHDVRIKRTIRNAPLATTGSFQDRTMGKVHGILRYIDEPPTKAPLSGRTCAYYEIIVEEYRSSGKSGSWHEIICERPTLWLPPADIATRPCAWCCRVAITPPSMSPTIPRC